ncbi:transposase IS3/IS911 family protein [Caballeronia catudaia]|uniref:Transposase IS3/IS911 family protein n=1 Tax=Caballeronia catudaia TaxID=1777136 RepID=A0A158C7F3_9BURK|nr:transposase IS3/IS911 family protein [Caballeronia catudaia]
MVVDGVSIDISAPTIKGSATANTLPAFVPVVTAPMAPSMASSPIPSMKLALHVLLPNGVELSFDEAGVGEITTIIQLLGRLPCSGLTNERLTGRRGLENA